MLFYNSIALKTSKLTLLQIGQLVTSDMIILFHFNEKDTLADSVCDVKSSQLGVFTWRRLSQPHPDLHAVASFVLGEVVDSEGRVIPSELKNVVTKITEHVFFTSTAHPEVSRIVVKLLTEIVSAREQGTDDWGYHHSRQYQDDLVDPIRIKKEQQRKESERLAPWELELMGASN